MRNSYEEWAQSATMCPPRRVGHAHLGGVSLTRAGRRNNVCSGARAASNGRRWWSSTADEWRLARLCGELACLENWVHGLSSRIVSGPQPNARRVDTRALEPTRVQPCVERMSLYQTYPARSQLREYAPFGTERYTAIDLAVTMKSDNRRALSFAQVACWSPQHVATA